MRDIVRGVSRNAVENPGGRAKAGRSYKAGQLATKSNGPVLIKVCGNTITVTWEPPKLSEFHVYGVTIYESL